MAKTKGSDMEAISPTGGRLVKYTSTQRVVTVEVPREPVLLRVDPVGMAEIVGNLLDNAAKFAPAPAPIVAEVRARRMAGAAVDVVTADRGLRERVAAVGGNVIGPAWLQSRI